MIIIVRTFKIRTMVNIVVNNKASGTTSSLRSEAIRLRTEERLSYSAIKSRLSVAKSTLSYWLKDYTLTESELLDLRRQGWSRGEASRERYRQTMRLKKVSKENQYYEHFKKYFRKTPKKSIFIAGLMLYLAEGDKKNPTRVVLANTDLLLINFFIRWVINYLDTDISDIRVQLHLYEDMDIEMETKYWAKGLKIDGRQFYKTQIRELRKSSFSYPESFRHGTCSIYILGVEKKMRLMSAIKAFLDTNTGT